MAIIKCEECGKEVSSKAKACPNCGFNVARSITNKNQLGCLSTAMVVLFMLLIGMTVYEALITINESPDENSPHPAKRKLSQSEKYEQRTGVSIPEDLEIQIISLVKDYPFRRAVKTRLSRPVSKEILTLIALQIKQMSPEDFKNTFINYYLPGMDSEDISWAQSHFTPELNIEINDWVLEIQNLKPENTDSHLK